MIVMMMMMIMMMEMTALPFGGAVVCLSKRMRAPVSKLCFIFYFSVLTSGNSPSHFCIMSSYKCPSDVLRQMSNNNNNRVCSSSSNNNNSISISSSNEKNNNNINYYYSAILLL